MSEVRVNNIVDYGGKGAPTFDNGAVISGVSSLGSQAKIGSNVTITSGGINVSGVTTAATLSGNLTGDVNSGFVTATSAVIGSGVTINAGGLNITGVVTATTFKGSGASMTGVAMTIAPLSYNPDVSDLTVPIGTGIGITFDHRILAGSGNVTLSIATNAGAAGTVVENFGVGSSVTIQGRKALIDPTANLASDTVYHISYPSGAFTNTSGDVSFVGTAYTFNSASSLPSLWSWGYGVKGRLGLNQSGANTYYSSPVQIPGTTWNKLPINGNRDSLEAGMATRTDGTLWTWGYNEHGQLGQNSTTYYSSPVQVPGTTWGEISASYAAMMSIKTDGELWVWGRNNYGALGVPSTGTAKRSSPIQVPGTWVVGTNKMSAGAGRSWAIKDGNTLWAWGRGKDGGLGLGNNTYYSSPVQIPGTTWRTVHAESVGGYATRTDGTLWAWGENATGQVGDNSTTARNSPVQVPGTNWGTYIDATSSTVIAVKTDGTLWAWGTNDDGPLGQNNRTKYSSPVQIPGTTWQQASIGDGGAVVALKTDGTAWGWGRGYKGQLGLNQSTGTYYSSPVQIPGTTWQNITTARWTSYGIKLA